MAKDTFHWTRITSYTKCGSYSKKVRCPHCEQVHEVWHFGWLESEVPWLWQVGAKNRLLGVGEGKADQRRKTMIPIVQDLKPLLDDYGHLTVSDLALLSLVSEGVDHRSALVQASGMQERTVYRRMDALSSKPALARREDLRKIPPVSTTGAKQETPA